MVGCNFRETSTCAEVQITALKLTLSLWWTKETLSSTSIYLCFTNEHNTSLLVDEVMNSNVAFLFPVKVSSQRIVPILFTISSSDILVDDSLILPHATAIPSLTLCAYKSVPLHIPHCMFHAASCKLLCSHITRVFFLVFLRREGGTLSVP